MAELSEVQERAFQRMQERQRALDSGACSECLKRRGTIRWGDSLALSHGWVQMRCERCVYGSQLRHALARAIRIPVLLVRFLWSLRPLSEHPGSSPNPTSPARAEHREDQ